MIRVASQVKSNVGASVSHFWPKARLDGMQKAQILPKCWFMSSEAKELHEYEVDFIPINSTVSIDLNRFIFSAKLIELIQFLFQVS